MPHVDLPPVVHQWLHDMQTDLTRYVIFAT